ncbi:23S rRNA m(5)U-1939 methyltransferase [Geothermobacter ehrlichii]|uniref:23S rRNA m(5)U-1939 methyltransferase n=1 Tax=Geothermobacter ehrlichii TaxID=213224 RepID=A0A5D3WPT3_9BACT|nr:23S rRNA (uracil(1939)-C(5))-methyltransferase RlmD [Geothermobacter ehrlichii]TYO99711.1 23S rRNA m(5)U-1939 methyltransferase [Geothermobacter ehrlichii]
MEIVIDSLAYGGDGVGRYEGQAVFVPFTLPGDVVRCRVVQRKKRYLRAEAVAWLQRGPGYSAPPCPVFGRCGGCQWQHIAYPEQVTFKDRLFRQILQRELRRDDLPVEPAVAAPSAWRYRHRVQYKCHFVPQGCQIGFYGRGSHFVHDVASCRIAASAADAVHAWLRTVIERFPRPDRIPQVDVAVGDRGAPTVILHLLAGQQVPPAVVASARDRGFGLWLQRGRKATLRPVAAGEVPAIVVDEPPLVLETVVGGFFQVNLEQNRHLVRTVIDYCDLRGDESVLDLFCGVGNLTLPLARRCREATGVEDFAPSVEKAVENARRNGISNARFIARDAGRHVASLDRAPDVVVLDPPRAGAIDCIRALLRLRPRRIVYVSCDPTTLARDLAPLLGQGYRLRRAVCLDLFPQTYHFESVCQLTDQAAE